MTIAPYDLDAARRVELRKKAAIDDAKSDPLPRPSVRGRRPTPEEVASCSAFKNLEAKALRLGWEVDSCYSRGPYLGSDGTALDTDSQMLGIGFRWEPHGKAEVVASWVLREGKDKWSFEGGWLTGHPIRLGANEIGYWLAGEAPPPPKKKKVTA